MKTMKFKAMLAASVFALTAVAAKTPDEFAKDKEAIRSDVANILYDRDKIEMVKKQYREAWKSDDEMAMIIYERELTKARADLKKDKIYLKADKCDLRKDHQLSIKNARKDAGTEKAELRTLKRKTWWTSIDDLPALQEQIKTQEQVVKDTKTELAEKRENREADMADVRKQVKDSRGESVLAEFSSWIERF